MKRFSVYCACVALSLAFQAEVFFQAEAQDFKYDWSVIPVTDKYDLPAGTPVAEIVAEAREGMEYLNEVVAVSACEMAVAKPESALSNLTADMIYDRAEVLTGMEVDCALYNMGGIRITLPAGEITLGDIVSCYPFNNTLIVAEIKGDRLAEFFKDFAAMNQPEAISGAKMEVTEDGNLLSVTVGGKEIDPSKTYRLASISFLVSGGDGFYLERYADRIVDTGVQVKDAVIAYCKESYKAGVKLCSGIEGRYVIVNKEGK